MSEPGKSMSDEEAFGPRPENGHQLAPHAGEDSTTPGASPGHALTDEQAFGAPGTDQHPTGFIRGAMDLGAAAWADFSRRDDQNNSGSSTPALDHYFQATPAGQMLKQFGQDTTAPFSAMTSLSTIDDGKGMDFLKRTGDQEQWKKNHTATTDDFRNSTMRPSAVSASGEMRGALQWLPYGKAIMDKYGEGIVGSLGQLRADLTNQKDDLSGYEGRPLLTKAIPYLHHWAMGAGGVTQTAAELFDTMMVGASLTGIPQAIGATTHEAAVGMAELMPLPGETPEQKQKRIQGAEDQFNIAAMVLGPEGAPMARSLSIARRLEAANKAGVIGKPPLFTDTGMDLKTAQQKAQATDKAAGLEPPVARQPGVPEPDLQASPPPSVDQGRPSVEAPGRDVHGTAREMAPDLFTRYDPLAARHQWYNDWLNELRANRNQDPRLQRAQDEIDGIMAKVGGVESRLTNRARTQIDDIRGGMQDFLTTDTPDMARVKEAMLENYQQMAPLQPEVQAAYRAAADRMGTDAEGRGEQSPVETAPAPEPEPEVHYPTVNESALEPKVNGELSTAPFVPPARELPGETSHIQSAADVAADVSRQLQAAGRPKEEADAQAQLIASHYEARAARFRGLRGTGADLYRAEGPAIQGVGRAARGQRTFAQTANALEDAVAGNFYSTLTRGVEALKQEKAPASQWLGIIDNLPGVKKEEIEWSEVKNWLGERTGAVTKTNLLNYLHENEVRIQEIEKGRTLRTVPNAEETEHAGEPMVDVVDANGRVFYTGGPTDAAEYIKEGPGGPKSTKFDSYTLPGGENYRELLLTLPEKPGVRGPKGWGDAHGGTADSANYRSSHWDEPNILAHIRFDDRTGPNGEKILHMAEVQSDWHQQGRRRGYAHQSQEMWVLRNKEGGLERRFNLDQEADARSLAKDKDLSVAREPVTDVKLGVPNAPFKTSWHELALKRMLRYAVEHGYDKLSWDTGDTNVARYDLSKQVDDILYRKEADGRYYIGARKDGKKVFENTVAAEKLPDIVGKEVADKIVNGGGEDFAVGGSPGKKLSGLDLKIGGEGMKGFYDKILPDFMNKYTKKWGAKIEDTELPSNEKSGFMNRAYEGPERSIAAIRAEAERFKGHQTWNNISIQLTKYADALEHGEHPEAAQRYLSDIAASVLGGKIVEHEGMLPGHPAHSIPITDAMRESVMQGQPMFQPNRGAITFKKGAAPTIRLMANADASTFLHETGHAWLEELMADAGHSQAPVQLQHDAAVTRAWLGVGEGEAIPRAAHEKWARGFERYLMEGIAPTRELASVFGRFKQWLVRIYKTATSLRSPINDDIRGVFDRLVASPDQPTIIAEPRNTSRVMADMHEVESGSTPPHLAGATADAIDREIETQLRRTAPEEHDALLRSELEGGAQQKPNAPSAGRLHETKPLAGPTSGNAAAGPLAAGEHELAPASSQLRAAASGAGGPAAGEQGLGGAEPVEARLARRLAGRGAGPDVGGRGVAPGLETPGTGPSVPSQLGLNVQARALAAGMPDQVMGEVLEHQQLSKAEQSEMAAQLLAENPLKAKAIAMGAQPSPNGLMSIFVYRAVEAQARNARDWATINELVQSKVLNSVTDAGRILNALADQDPSSPLAAMKAVQKARENAITLGQKGINPTLTPAEQARIGEATTRADDLMADWKAHGMDPDDMPRRIAATRAQMDVTKIVESMKPGQPFWSWNTLWQVWGVPKSLLTSIFHFSAPFVQGRGLIATSYWWKGFGEMYRYFGSEDAYLDNNAWIISHPDFKLLEQGKVALGKLGDKVSEREEAIQSSLVEQASHALSGATGIPDLVRASSRAFSGYINYIRAHTFYDLIASARAAGEDLSTASHNVRDIGNMINDFTGRGNLGVDDKFGNAAPAANMMFFTVRKISGTMNMFNPERYLNPNISKTARRAAVQQLMGHVATTASVVGLAQAVGLNVEMDPNSSDFMLVKIGDTSFDLSGGSITYARMWARMIKWGWNHYVEGDDSKTAGRTAYEDVGQYFRNSLAPTAGFIADALYGKDPAGRPFTISDELSDKLVPITIGEVIDFAAYDGQNYAAILPALSGIFGVRVKTPLGPKDMMGLNVWGEPTSHFSKSLNSPVDQELKQIGYSMGFAPPKIQGVKLTTLQRQAFIQISGRMAFENIQNDMSLPSWADYPKEEKLRMVRADVSAARRDAQDQIMSDDMATAAPGESIADKATKLQNAKDGIDQ